LAAAFLGAAAFLTTFFAATFLGAAFFAATFFGAAFFTTFLAATFLGAAFFAAAFFGAAFFTAAFFAGAFFTAAFLAGAFLAGAFFAVAITFLLDQVTRELSEHQRLPFAALAIARQLFITRKSAQEGRPGTMNGVANRGQRFLCRCFTPCEFLTAHFHTNTTLNLIGSRSRQSQESAPPDWYSMTRVSKKLRSFFRSIISLIHGNGFSSFGKSSSKPIWVARRLAM
jgi:hypothetical protein